MIGATGGSGTRVVARIVRQGGLFIGAKLNESEDAVDFGAYSDRWVNPFIAAQESQLSPMTRAEMIADLGELLESHLATLGPAAQAWGWKEPRCIYLLPFFHRQFPEMRFLHVVRDGRDMAYSGNQNQLRKHGEALLNQAERELSQPLQSLTLWSRLNLMAADYGERELGRHYLRVRFEDLCADPVPTIRRIFNFFGLEGDAEQLARVEVAPPGSMGRWRSAADETVPELHQVGAVALNRFGYV